ncbi:MAG TPA: DUF3124 domain-containing protein [Methylococcaceae bacterium]|jgi:hypothetical protein|nr:DUF3124 domain-containing protein [Methylococcaceae bacterium]
MTTLQPVRLTPVRLWLALLAASLSVQAEELRSHGQVLYVPVYSEVPYGDKGFNINLTATLSIRNTDGKNPISIERVDYFSSTGVLVRSYLKQPMLLKPMSSAEHIVKESDRSGGISASFLVEWASKVPVAPPIVEAVMVNSTYNNGIAFNSQARVLEEKP